MDERLTRTSTPDGRRTSRYPLFVNQPAWWKRGVDEGRLTLSAYRCGNRRRYDSILRLKRWLGAKEGLLAT
ncbi:hypothetical protein AC480_01930 [miscellaneous Crenarchaeota group archaeon SMTZ1-55]|nr:MAG: hypothetical protein AC480_01930 [miscellaneous Crenarchaeota group archaeon SMTZ1-55]